MIDDAAKLAQQYANCTNRCLYVIPTLPGLASHTTLFFAKATVANVPDPEAQSLLLAHALEVPAGPTLLNSYYNYGSVGTYTKNGVAYSVLIMTHYLVLTPIQYPVPAAK
jgi:hypothetical protein